MKLDARHFAGFMREAGKARFVLLYGDDEGLIRERARMLTGKVAGAVDDPFLVAELNRDAWARIGGEVAALSMIGGRRVVLVRDAGEAVLPHLIAALRGPGEAFVILEAAGLGRGKLRSFAEASTDGYAIGCYPEEGHALATLISDLLAEGKLTADPEALAHLTQTLAGDRAVIRAEVEKLVLLTGPGGRLDLDTVRACTGDGASSAGDDGIMAAALGECDVADLSVEAAISDGLSGVALLRLALMHLQKMHQAKLRIQSGQTVGEAVKAMRPPLFYKAIPRISAALTLWTVDGLFRVIEEARRVEMACKQTGSRPELLARRFVQTVARTARAQKSRSLA